MKKRTKLIYLLAAALALLVIIDFLFILFYINKDNVSDSGIIENNILEFNPSNFVLGINNPYYSLIPETMYTYESETEDGLEKNIVTVTSEKKEILGVQTTVVWDRVWLDDELIEETYDWYSQDNEGNIWYFGEDSKEYEDGVVVSTKGSWEAGVDGAQQGIIMKANPQPGDSYRQEYYRGEAEDMAEVISIDETVTVPYGTYTNCLKTKEWNPLEPGSEEYKYYCPDIGLVLEIVVDSGEKVELTST